MGIFDKLFKKHKGDDKYILFAKAGLLLSHADGDFSDQENQWIVEYVESIPKITEDRVDNILKKGSENLAEISSFSELKSLNDKKEFINFLIGVAKADGNLDALELKFITNLIEHLSVQDEYEVFLNSIDKKNIEENHDYKNALQVFFKKMENPVIKPWYEIIQKRAEMQSLPDVKNGDVLDYAVDLEASAFFHLKEYVPRIKLDISDKYKLDISDLEDRINVFTQIIDALSLLIVKAADLKIDIHKQLLNDYHSAISSRMGSELGLKVINQKTKVSSEAETVFKRINKKYLAIKKTEKIDFITFITNYLETYFLEYLKKLLTEIEDDEENISEILKGFQRTEEENKPINESNSSNKVAEESSSPSFASGWTVNELKAAYWFEQSIFISYPQTNEKEDFRLGAIIEFIQLAFKNIYNINTIVQNKDWTFFMENVINHKKNDLKESLKVLMLMDKRKRLELLYIYHQLMGLTNQLIKNSNKNDNEIKLITSKFLELNSMNEKMLQVKLTEEEYQNIHKKYCKEDDRQKL